MNSNGTMTVPTQAGLGVEVDRDRIENLTVRAVTLS
jgi:L-alanine-DL-glutamate epimerase-like enolase superfamily enzyme